FAADGRTVALAGADQVIRLVDATTGTERAALGTAVKQQGTVAALSVSALALSADGRILAAGRKTDRKTSLQVWDVFTNTLIHDLDNKEAWIIAIVLSPDGRLVAYRDQGSHMNMVEVASGRRLWRLEHQGRVGGLTEAFSQDGRFLTSA